MAQIIGVPDCEQQSCSGDYVEQMHGGKVSDQHAQSQHSEDVSERVKRRLFIKVAEIGAEFEKNLKTPHCLPPSELSIGTLPDHCLASRLGKCDNVLMFYPSNLKNCPGCASNPGNTVFKSLLPR